MRAPVGVYVAVVALAFGVATVLTRLVSPNDNFVASLLDGIAFADAGELKDLDRPVRLYRVDYDRPAVR